MIIPWDKISYIKNEVHNLIKETVQLVEMRGVHPGPSVCLQLRECSVNQLAVHASHEPHDCFCPTTNGFLINEDRF